MAKSKPTERADLRFSDLTPEEREQVRNEFAGVFIGGLQSVFYTKWTDGKWSACATRPLWSEKRS